ncbi:hypothetical protein JM49_18680 [Pseudomonas chlororaphis subsp. aurantiaca]|uniref:hypothetical protein n=1 Tax=Pseudomonas chlororaphis TaxID=587753 RepID=UPI00050D7461|nr:hypothetical protein [Pseudomonas chlororaphis]AIS13601.1 hypothetical protein JM49_18680 [Pseudomonas chlororaphis subsp. aurantiaca]
MVQARIDETQTIGSRIWTWYGQDEYRKIILVGELGPALEFLALDSGRQRTEIGCCAECNLWSDYLDYLVHFVQRFPARLAPHLHQRLQTLLSACEALSPQAYGMTLEDNGFEHPQWAPLRLDAQEALELLGWPEVQEHMPELTEECRAALKKWPD